MSTKPQEFYEISHTQPNVKQLTIDLCMFLQSEHATAPYQVQGSLTEARTLLAWVELPVFVELELEAAPFNFDDNALVITDTDLGGKSQARLACCAGEIQLYQHRVFLFTIWIQRDWVRLMRWDRRALVLSSAFNYVEDPTRLLEFLCRFTNASPTQRGHDPSVVFAARAEIDTLLRYEPRNRWERTYHAEMIQNLDIYPVRKVCVTSTYDVCEDGINSLWTARLLSLDFHKTEKAVLQRQHRNARISSDVIVTQSTSRWEAEQSVMWRTALLNVVYYSSRTSGIHLALLYWMRTRHMMF